MTELEKCDHPKIRYALERRVEGIVLVEHCDKCEARGRAKDSAVIPYFDAAPMGEQEWFKKYDKKREKI